MVVVNLLPLMRFVATTPVTIYRQPAEAAVDVFGAREISVTLSVPYLYFASAKAKFFATLQTAAEPDLEDNWVDVCDLIYLTTPPAALPYTRHCYFARAGSSGVSGRPGLSRFIRAVVSAQGPTGTLAVAGIKVLLK